jgi:uncharacterized protein YcbK (DUF882 family)
LDSAPQRSPRSTLRPAFAAAHRALAFRNLHTGESLSVTYWTDGQYVPDSLAQLDRVLRDHRNGEVQPIDRKLFDFLAELAQALGTSGPYLVISGYRSPQTNALLARKGRGVAESSLHQLGLAIDVRLADRTLEDLRDQALALERGGVGYYPRSNFVHLDTGRVRRW